MMNKANKKRIVVVDSDPLVREMLPDFLNDAGYSTYARETPSQVKTDLEAGVAVDAIITGLHFHGGGHPWDDARGMAQDRPPEDQNYCVHRDARFLPQGNPLREKTPREFDSV